VSERDWLTDGFAAHRSHLRTVAQRMLGSASEADDAVQEAWLRLSRSDVSAVQNLRGWLTTVVGRVCLDMLRARTARREEPLDEHAPELSDTPTDEDDPEQEALLADSVGLALTVVLDTLTPTERLAFVLHDVFAVPFDEIAQILQRTPAAAKMIASRARRKVQAADPAPGDHDLARQRSVVDAFLAASRNGDFEALIALLDPDVVARADRTAIATLSAGAVAELRGAAAVARQFMGRAGGIRPAVINGAAGGVWAPGGQPRVVLAFTISREKIVAIDIVADPHQLSHLDVTQLPRPKAQPPGHRERTNTHPTPE
jgi:RNA polymerase sigma-70 factor, ECF subfamily